MNRFFMCGSAGRLDHCGHDFTGTNGFHLRFIAPRQLVNFTGHVLTPALAPPVVMLLMVSALTHLDPIVSHSSALPTTKTTAEKQTHDQKACNYLYAGFIVHLKYIEARS